MLVIHDADLVGQLEQIAKRENRPVEDVIKSMVDQYPGASSPEPAEPGMSDAVKRVRRKIYAMARRHWQSVGDTAHLALTDEELDEQFGAFDEEGIPRLKSELKSLEPPPGSLGYALKVSRSNPFHSGQPDLARRSREILEEHFADDLLKHMRGEDATD